MGLKRPLFSFSLVVLLLGLSSLCLEYTHFSVQTATFGDLVNYLKGIVLPSILVPVKLSQYSWLYVHDTATPSIRER